MNADPSFASGTAPTGNADNLGASAVSLGADSRIYKILVVDDSPTIRKSAEIFLKQGGYEVLMAEDGFDALAQVHDLHPDLVFCDILMPRLDGYQTCTILKRNPRFSALPVVMLSSKDGIFDKMRGNLAGASDYLTKPFTKVQLLNAIRQHLHTD